MYGMKRWASPPEKKNDPATSGEVSQETWMMYAAPLRGTKLLYAFLLKVSGGLQ
jgi:hypothetical protein